MQCQINIKAWKEIEMHGCHQRPSVICVPRVPVLQYTSIHMLRAYMVLANRDNLVQQHSDPGHLVDEYLKDAQFSFRTFLPLHSL